jgi:hypothetical protein|tara:strand:+ start:11135 stop:11620 length:486 start_codon:yes stop_codon:yes gene_type:complete
MSATWIEKMNVYNAANSGFIAANEDIFAGDPATDVLSMENYKSMVFIIVKNAGATGTATITVESCDTVVPGTGTAIAFHYKACTSGNTWGATTAATTAGFTTTAGANQCYVIEVSSEELSGTDSFVRLQATEVVNSPCDGAILAIAMTPRYDKEVQLDITA